MATEPRRLGKYGVLSREIIRDFIKKAHEECRKKIKFVRHEIGGKLGGRPRVSLRRSREEYIGCIRDMIRELVDKKLEELTK
jgi:hypothetical protein